MCADEDFLVIRARRRATDRARQWRTSRIERFTERQRSDRQWINFDEITDWCAREDGSIRPDEEKRALAFNTLAEDLRAGEFDEDGRSQVLFLSPNSPKKARMTRDYLTNVIETDFYDEGFRSEFLPFCWVRREMAEQWFEKRRLGKLPTHFEPQRSHDDRPTARHESKAAVSACTTSTQALRPVSLANLHKHLPFFLRELSERAQANGAAFNQVIARTKAEAHFKRRIPRRDFRNIYRDAAVKRRAGRRRKMPPSRILPKS